MPRKAASSSTQDRDRSGRIVDAALRLAEGGDWAGVSLAHVAREAGLTVAQVYAVHPSKAAILDAFVRRIDDEMAGADTAEVPDEGAAEEISVSARERLFDVVMRRFDALLPHREAVRAIVRDSGGDPVTALSGLASLLRSMALVLETAGVSSDGLRGAFRTQGMAAVYAYAFRTWLDDDTPDMARTMAALDKALRRAESFGGLLGPRRRYRRPAPGGRRPPETGEEPQPVAP